MLDLLRQARNFWREKKKERDGRRDVRGRR
jgi:hypothetical protein